MFLSLFNPRLNIILSFKLGISSFNSVSWMSSSKLNEIWFTKKQEINITLVFYLNNFRFSYTPANIRLNFLSEIEAYGLGPKHNYN